MTNTMTNTNVINNTFDCTEIVLKSLVMLAARTEYLPQELHKKRLSAQSFFRNLGKWSRLRSRIESQPTTSREFERREEAKASLGFVERKLSVDCISFGLPSNLSLIDDSLHNLFGKRAEAIAQIVARKITVL